MADGRVIIHVDMDAFFAAIEQRDSPELRGRPVVIGADPQGGKGRGVVSTCSYEARRYGIHSAQPISRAYRLCPDAEFLPVDGEKYARESRRVRRILGEFTPQIQFVSIDEGYLDVTGSLSLFGGKRRIAELIQERIESETGLTASLGVGPNKLVAKIASDLEKPRGLVIVEPEQAAEFLRPLDIRRLPGVGPKTQRVLRRLGVHTIGDLADMPVETLRQRFGEHGEDMHRRALGRDQSPIEEGEEAKSIGHEHTFGEDTGDAELIRSMLMRLCEKTARRVRKAGRLARTVTTKVRFADFTTVTRQQTLEAPIADAAELYEVALQNYHAAGVGRRKVRLIGVQVSGWPPPGAPVQRPLFEDSEAEHGRSARVARAEDAVKDRYGDDAIRRGASFRPRPPKPPDKEA